MLPGTAHHSCGIIEGCPTPADYNRLRTAVGWGAYREDVIQSSLARSLYCVCAVIDSAVVGMARVIGDGGMVYYIQDVIVLPVYQRKGIGTKLMDAVMAYINAHASHNAIVGLMSAKGKEPFYEKYGFVSRPNATMGAGMVLFWKEE